MFPKTLLFLSLSGFLFASSNYTVRLAVYKNPAKLTQALELYPPALKKTIRTYKKKGFTYAYTLPTTDKKTLKRLLPAYRKVFKDAYIQPTRLK